MTPSQPPLVTRQGNFGSRATTSIDFALGRFVKKRLREPRASSRNQAPVAGCENLSRRFPTVRMYFESSEFRSKALIGSISHKRDYRNAKPCHACSQAGLFADDDFGINRQGAAVATSDSAETKAKVPMHAMPSSRRSTRASEMDSASQVGRDRQGCLSSETARGRRRHFIGGSQRELRPSFIGDGDRK